MDTRSERRHSPLTSHHWPLHARTLHQLADHRASVYSNDGTSGSGGAGPGPSPGKKPAPRVVNKSKPAAGAGAGAGEKPKPKPRRTRRQPPPFSCSHAQCSCSLFAFHVQQYGWEVKCQCKHKHTDHSASSPHACARKDVKGVGGNAGPCDCAGFHATWVCNCGHGWGVHETAFQTGGYCERAREWVAGGVRPEVGTLQGR